MVRRDRHTEEPDSQPGGRALPCLCPRGCGIVCRQAGGPRGAPAGAKAKWSLSPVWVTTGLMQCSITTSFNHFVGAEYKRFPVSSAERILWAQGQGQAAV